MIHVADPAKGLLTYTEQEFCEHWVSTQDHGEGKGIALLLEPSEGFYSGQDTGAIAKRGSRLVFLWGYLRRYKRFFSQLILGLRWGRSFSSCSHSSRRPLWIQAWEGAILALCGSCFWRS